jgi:hypothetical protein
MYPNGCKRCSRSKQRSFALPAPGLPALTCHYIRSAYYRVTQGNSPEPIYRISPESEGAQFPRTRTRKCNPRRPVFVARSRSSIVIVLVLGFLHRNALQRDGGQLALINVKHVLSGIHEANAYNKPGTRFADMHLLQARCWLM